MRHRFYQAIIDNMTNGNWGDAADMLVKGAKSKPYLIAARAVRLCGILHEDGREDDAARLMKVLHIRTTQLDSTSG